MFMLHIYLDTTNVLQSGPCVGPFHFVNNPPLPKITRVPLKASKLSIRFYQAY